MQLSRYDILSYARLSFDIRFHCKKSNLEKFDKFDIVDSNSSKTLTTETMPFAKAKYTLANILSLINKHAKTEWSDYITVNISFSTDVANIYQINALKLVLSFDDKYLYEMFPDRKNRVGSRSVSELINSGVTNDSIRSLLSSNIYGIDLSNIGDNIISYRYIGGENYQDKFQEISAIIDKWIVDTYTVIENPEYSQEDIERLSKLSKEGCSYEDYFVSYDEFKRHFRHVKLMVDLYELNGYENVYWASIKDRLFALFKSLKSAETMSLTINYDSDTGRLQIKDSKLYAVANLNDIDVVDSVISGSMSHVTLYYSHVINTDADFCEFFSGCDIMKSEISNSYITDGVEVTDSTIVGDSTVSGDCADCELAAGVKYTKNAKFKNCKNNATKI